MAFSGEKRPNAACYAGRWIHLRTESAAGVRDSQLAINISRLHQPDRRNPVGMRVSSLAALIVIYLFSFSLAISRRFLRNIRSM
jgi:hypothetical protein